MGYSIRKGAKLGVVQAMIARIPIVKLPTVPDNGTGTHNIMYSIGCMIGLLVNHSVGEGYGTETP